MYKLKQDYLELEEGTILYIPRVTDYGMSIADSLRKKELCVPVSIDFSGSYPLYSIPLSLLDRVIH